MLTLSHETVGDWSKFMTPNCGHIRYRPTSGALGHELGILDASFFFDASDLRALGRLLIAIADGADAEGALKAANEDDDRLGKIVFTEPKLPTDQQRVVDLLVARGQMARPDIAKALGLTLTDTEFMSDMFTDGTLTCAYGAPSVDGFSPAKLTAKGRALVSKPAKYEHVDTSGFTPYQGPKAASGSDTFAVVLRDDDSRLYRHASVASAVAEAERLAGKNEGHKFYVLPAVTVSTVVPAASFTGREFIAQPGGPRVKIVRFGGGDYGISINDSSPNNYATPAELRQCGDFIKNEADRIERESKVVKVRDLTLSEEVTF